MLENFTETQFSDNRPVIEEEERDGIVRGATCTHIFELPFVYNDGFAESVSVIYTQGLKKVLTKNITIIPAQTEAEKSSTVTLTLSPEETLGYFEQTLLDVYVQLKVVTKATETKASETLFNTPIKLVIESALDTYPETASNDE